MISLKYIMASRDMDHATWIMTGIPVNNDNWSFHVNLELKRQRRGEQVHRRACLHQMDRECLAAAASYHTSIHKQPAGDTTSGTGLGRCPARWPITCDPCRRDVPMQQNTRRSPNVGSMLGQLCRRWANIYRALGERLVFAGVGLVQTSEAASVLHNVFRSPAESQHGVVSQAHKTTRPGIPPMLDRCLSRWPRI